MWLLVKYLIGLLSVIQGLYFSAALNIDAHKTSCIAKILSCDWYRQPFSLYKYKKIGMFTKIEDLNEACKEQAAYSQCLVRAENFCEQSIFSPMVEEMIKSRRFPAEICRPASPWQQLYLKEASCLNTYSWKALIYCFDKFIGTDNLDLGITLERGCKYGKAIIDCCASALQEKCGYYAGNILRKFLKFHSLSEYKCFEFKPEEVEDNSFSSTPVYDITEAIFNVLETAVFSEDFDNKATEDEVNTNLDRTKEENLEKQISPYDTISEDAFTPFDFTNPLADESFTTAESFIDSLNSDAELQDITESEELDFPALPKHDYIHKNRTNFALYEDLEMGHMKYMGCGEADFFWVILSPLRSKYCILTDLKSEYSEAIFKCTVRIDAPCSPEIDDEDKTKKAEVHLHRYVASVLTPPNNQRSEDMAIMNVHYLKLYPSTSTYVPENKVNVWITEANTVDIDPTESVSRKGQLEEDNNIEILHQRGKGSGEKWDSPTHMDEDFEEDETWDYYPQEEEDDIYFPEILTNNIIYIEDDKGDLISLHDHRSPIYSKTAYQPHSLFRPRTGEMPASTKARHTDEVETNQNKKFVQQSIRKERVSELQDELFVSKVKSDRHGYCSAESPCDADSELISEFGIKPSMNILPRNIKSFDPLKGVNQFLQRIPSSTKLNSLIDSKPIIFSEVYVITPSTKIEVPESTEMGQTDLYEDEFVTDRSGYSPEDEFATGCSMNSPEDDFVMNRSGGRFSEEDEFVKDQTKYLPEEDEFETGHFRYPPTEESYDNVGDITGDSRYLDPDYSSFVTNSPNSADSETDYMEIFSDKYFDEFSQPPYKCLHEHIDTKVNPKDTIHPKNLKELSTEIENVWEKYLTNIIRNVSKALLKTEKFPQQELLDEIFITLLERAESILNL